MSSQHDEATIRQWIVDYLVDVLDLEKEAVGATTRFDHLGVDSTTAVAMSGDLSEWLGKELAPTLLYDHPTVDELVSQLSQ